MKPISSRRIAILLILVFAGLAIIAAVDWLAMQFGLWMGVKPDSAPPP